MKKLFNDALESACESSNSTEKLINLTSLLRSILQTAQVVILEVIQERTPNDEVDIQQFINRLEKPSDGLPIEFIGAVLPHLRTYLQRNFLDGWFEATVAHPKSLNDGLLEWVQFRNSRSGHGVLDSKISEIWSAKTHDLVVRTLVVFSKIIPNMNGGSPKLSSEMGNIVVKTPLTKFDKPIVITGIGQKKGLWRLKGQTLCKSNSVEFSVELAHENVFWESIQSKPKELYSYSEVTYRNKKISFWHNLPIRQTGNFEGRRKEIDMIHDWMHDEDSRQCLIYGDGGFGKTTLVLEFFNKLLDDLVEIDREPPTLICYYTAKKTKWTESGLTHIHGVSDSMAECIRELMRYFIPQLGKEWFGIAERRLIDKAKTVLSNEGFDRDDILLIIDNTETLATSVQDVEDLGNFFKIIGKNLGRLIITSRRRELLEANPIEVKGLSLDECINLMNRIAIDCGAESVIRAGDKRLRKVAEKLGNKPLLLEVFVKHSANSKKGIDESLDHILTKTNEDLLEFLYEDAWARMTEEQQNVFMTLVVLDIPLDNNSIGNVCRLVGISQSEFLSSLGETSFASFTERGSSFEFELIDLSKRYFERKLSNIPSTVRDKLLEYARSTEEHITDLKRIEQEYRADRVADAFRNYYAKEAKILVDKNELRQAVEMFEFAIEEDMLNSALHDRFAWVLFNKLYDYEYSERMAKKAIELDANCCDSLVTLALIYYRKNDIKTGDKYIEEARDKGRSKAFSLLRKAIARYHKSLSETDLDSAVELLVKSQVMLSEAEKQRSSNDPYHKKNRQLIFKYQSLSKKELTKKRTERTRRLNT